MTNFKIPFFVVLALLLLSNIGWIWERTTFKFDPMTGTALPGSGQSTGTPKMMRAA